MTEFGAENMQKALSALRHLSDGEGDFYASAARILGQTLDCEAVLVLPHADTSKTAIAVYGAGDEHSEASTSTIAAVWELIAHNDAKTEEFRSILDIPGLNGIHALACPCLDIDGRMKGYLVALTETAIIEGGFAETYIALISQRIGSKLSRQINQKYLQSSEDNFRQLIENMSAGFYVHDDQRPLFINRAMSDMYGYSGPEELMAIGDLKVLWSPREADRIQRLADSRKSNVAAPHVYECEGIKKDGSQIWIRVTSQTIQWQGKTLVSGTIHDITDERASEEVLLESNKWFRQVVEFSPAGIAFKDVHGRYLLVNHRYREQFDLGDRDIVGKTIFDLVPKSEAAFSTSGDQAALNASTSVARPNQHTRPDGTVADYETTKFLIADHHDQPLGIGVMVVDVTAHKQAATELIEKSRVLEAILEAAPAMISYRDNQGRYKFVNQPAAAVHGLTPVDMMGKTRIELFGESPTQNDFDDALKLAHAGQATFDFEMPSKRYSGKAFSFSFVPVFDNGGDNIGIVTTVLDITERKRAETILQKNERALSEALRIGLMGHWRLYPDTGKVEISDQVYRIHGFSEDDKKRSAARLQEAIYPDDREELKKVWARTLIDDEPYRFSYRTTRPDGELRFMAGEARPEYDENGEIVSIFGVTQDITDRHKIENDLRDSQTRLADFADASADLFWQTDAELRYSYFSESLEENVPLKITETLGRHVEDSIAPSFKAMDPWQFIMGQFQSRQPFRDVVFQRQGAKDDESVWLRTSAKPYFDEHGVFGGFRGTSTNITEHRALEEQLIQAQKMETVGQLTGGVAHDFNNLLAVILGNAEMLAENFLHTNGQEQPAFEGQNNIDAVLRAAHRGAELTQQLLAFSRKQTLAPKVVQLDQQIFGMITILQRSIGAAINIETSGSAGLWPCYVDPGQVENVMLNLAINARDAMPNGGKLSIETANTSLNDDYAAAQTDLKPGEYVTLSVTDTGTGMTPEVKSRVFEPFFTTKGQGKGTGLGLSMVFGFAKQSNGHVTIYSEVGHGTTIKLYLPRSVVATDQANKTIAEESPVPEARGECILVVEDDADVRTLSVALLASLGYQVLEAPDAAVAISVLKRERHIDLLLTDVILPNGVNGDAIARQAPLYHPNIKHMYMSGYTQDALVHQGRLDDGVILLQKPFRKADLAQKLRDAIDG